MQSKVYRLGARLGMLLATIFISLASANKTLAQASSYSFSQSSGTYSALSGGTVLSSGAGMDDATFSVTIPSFSFNGTAYTQVYVSENGYISFGSTNPGTSTRTFLSTAGGITTGGVSGYSKDLGGKSATSDLQWQTAGGVTTFQWTNLADYASTSQTITFQIRLNHTTNVISVVYGAMSATSSTSAQVGIRTTTSDFNNRSSSTSWTATTAGTSNSATVTLSSTVAPTPGLTFTWTPPPACNAAPAPVTSTATPAFTCSGGNSVITLAGTPTGITGITYQWQSSTTSSTTGFTNISGATTTSYTTPLLSTTTYYRAIIKCTNTNDSIFSSVATVTVGVAPTPTVATIPYTQSFESWVAGCGITDRPGTEWLVQPFRTDSAWRRHDQGASAGWTSTSGAYSPVSTAGSSSARFHSYDVSGGRSGSMLLHLNMSAAGYKLISFDHINTSGTDTLFVELSTDAGASYSQLAAYGTASTWTSRLVITTVTAANAILRFRVKSDFGSTDVGMDNLNISVTTCPPPGTPTASSITATSASISWPASVVTPGLGYYFEVRTSGAAGSGPNGLFTSGLVSNTTTNVFVAGLTGQTNYDVYVRAVCSTTDSSAIRSVSFTTLINCAAATNITACGVTQTYTIAAGTGLYNPVIVASGTAPYGTPGREQLFTFTAPTTGVYTINVTAATGGYTDYFFKPASGGCGNTGWTYIDDVNAPVANTVTLTGGVQYYLLSDPENTTGISQTFTIICPPTCGQPTAFSATTTTANSATLAWTQPTLGSPTQWQISYGPTGTTAVAGTKVIATTNPYTLGGLTSGTSYVAYVRAICGAGDSSAWSSSTSFNTQCVASTLPFVENFATVLPSPCWSRATGFLTTAPTALTATTSNAWFSDQYLNNSANGASAAINLYTTGKRDWLISPTIDLGATAANYVLEFNLGIVTYSSSTTVTTPAGVMLGSDDTVAVVISTNNGATWTRANALRTWTAANTPISATGTSRIYIPLNGYSGQIKIGFYGGEGTVDDAPDNDIFIDSMRVVTCTAPAFSLGPDTAACSGASITLSASGGATGYMWSTGATTQSISVGTAGTYSVTAYNGSVGCATSDTIVVTTGTNPTVNLGNDTAFCAGGSVTLNAGNAGATYLYNTGATAQTLQVAASGQYSVRVRNAQGCFGRDTVNVTVRPLPVVNLGSDTAVCGNVQSYVLNAGNNPGATFTWMGTTVTAQTLNIAPFLNALNNGPIVTGTIYTSAVTVTDSFGCTNRDTIRVTVNFSARVSDFTINGQDPTLTFTPVGDSAATSYSWSFGDGGTATTRIATRTFASGGVYNVRLIVINACGRDTVLKQVQVNTAGVGEVISAENIALYPNPTAADAVLEVEGGSTLRSIQVVSATGALVMNESASGTRTTIRTATLAPGIYTLRIQLDKGVVIRKLEVIR